MQIETWLYPDLKTIKPEQRSAALREAKNGAFDFVEVAGLAVALLVVVTITRYSAAGFGMADRFAAMLFNFAVAIPLLAIFGGPFLVRRVRRGLRTYIKQHPDHRLGS